MYDGRTIDIISKAFNSGEKVFGSTSYSAGDINDEKRNRLAPEWAEALTLTKKNFSLVGGNYQY